MSELFEILDHTINELGANDPKYVLSDDTLEKAITLMKENKIGCCLVIDEKVSLKGIITERDVLNYIVGSDNLLKEPVSKYMTTNPQTIKANDSIVTALQMMSFGNFRNLPVVNLENRPIGMIAISDIMRFLANHLRD